jgi:hypothetical protein
MLRSGTAILGLDSARSILVDRLRTWPSPAEYSEALQNPQSALLDPALWEFEAETDALGLPKPISGGFASVYRLKLDVRGDWAIRCFLQPAQDQQLRYGEISRFVMNDDLPYTVAFNYSPEGIRIRSQLFPVLKMEWVTGDTLERHIEKNLNPAALNQLCAKFTIMCSELRRAGIAHGDFQHGNIIVTPAAELSHAYQIEPELLRAKPLLFLNLLTLKEP